MPPSAALLLLADGRFPSGGYAHSGGVEEAVSDGRVRDLATLEAFLRGRLWTVARAEAGIAAAACEEALAGAPRWRALDEEAAARCPSPALRRASRAIGRALVRAASVAWPGAWADDLRHALPEGPMAPLAVGAACHAAGGSREEAARVAAYHAVTGPGTAAVRLLGLDPLEVSAVLARLAPDVDAVAVLPLPAEWCQLPAGSAPLTDVGAEHHASREVRLFAS